MLIKAGDFQPQKPTMKSVLVLECVLHWQFLFAFTISEISSGINCARLLCPS